MNNSPKVSVIVPVYNVEHYISECLDSIVNQSLEDIEIICVDDGSTDGSLAILNEYAQKDSRITVVRQNNLGAGAARNNGLKYVKGKYISLLDGDDFFHKDMLLTAVNKAESTGAQVVMYRTQQYHEAEDKYVKCPWTIKKEYLPQKDVFSPEEITKNFFNAILGYTWDKLFDAEYVKENNFCFQEQPVFNDAYFVYTAMLKAEKLALIDEYLCFQRKREALTSITDRRSCFTDCAYGLLKGLKEFLEDNNLTDKYGQDFANYSVHLFSIDLNGKKGKKFQKEISCLRTKWMKELDLLKSDDYYYNKEQYHKLCSMVYDNKDILDLNFNQGTDNITIPVVYATDYNYLRYTLVSMCSILQQPSVNITYRFIILIPKGDTEGYKNLINDSLGVYNNFTVEIYEMGEEFDNVYLAIKNITTPTYYRLLLPEILKDCDKCIYMDGDTAVVDDLFNLYSIDIKDNYIGAVEALGYYENREYNANRLNITPSEDFEYYNAGVLLMNLKKLREDNVVEKFMALINDKFDSQDQDIINVVCKDRILKISSAYNVMTKYNSWDDKRFLKVISESEYDEYKKQISKPVIIHYADKLKPWNSLEFRYAEHWWKAALASPCWKLFADEKTDLIVEWVCNSEQIKSVITLNQNLQNLEKEYKELEKELQKNSKELQRNNKELQKNNKELQKVTNEVQKLTKTNERLKRDLNSVYNSASFKAGRAITFVPRKIRGCLKCLKDNGLGYTIKRIFIKITGKSDK